MNRLLMVTGSQGSGKTSVIKYLVKKYGFSSIHNEDMYVKYQKEHPYISVISSEELTDLIYQETERKIRETIKSSNVVYEATGAKPQWKKLLARLKDLNPAVIMVRCPPEIALERHKTEDKTEKYIAPESHSKELSEMLEKSDIKSDFVINNNGPFSETEMQIDNMMRWCESNEK